LRVAQESLTNVIRHAAVNEAKVELHYDSSRVTMEICDQGQGFNSAEKFDPPRGWGLAGMRERVESLAGQLILEAAPGQGTIIKVVIPLNDERGKESPNGANYLIARG